MQKHRITGPKPPVGVPAEGLSAPSVETVQSSAVFFLLFLFPHSQIFPRRIFFKNTFAWVNTVLFMIAFDFVDIYGNYLESRGVFGNMHTLQPAIVN